MKIYVAGPLADVVTVRAVQSAVVAAGHELTLDWTEDASFVEDYGSQLDVSGKLAREELDAVMAADAVLVVASQHDGRGMFVELGAALTRAQLGELSHVVIVGEIRHESVFYFHPLVQRVASVEEWLEHLRYARPLSGGQGGGCRGEASPRHALGPPTIEEALDAVPVLDVVGSWIG